MDHSSSEQDDVRHIAGLELFVLFVPRRVRTQVEEMNEEGQGVGVAEIHLEF